MRKSTIQRILLGVTVTGIVGAVVLAAGPALGVVGTAVTSLLTLTGTSVGAFAGSVGGFLLRKLLGSKANTSMIAGAIAGMALGGFGSYTGSSALFKNSDTKKEFNQSVTPATGTTVAPVQNNLEKPAKRAR